ncbi:MAG: dipeptidase [Oscillospiraceae bacterium]|nr:dipeptidase [Oscillospiraceae bacterium]
MRIIDWHCDTILGMYERKESIYSNSLSIDINKLKEGNVFGQFFALYINLKDHQDPFLFCNELLDLFQDEVKKNDEYLEHVKNYDEMVNANDKGKIAAILTIEDGGAVFGKMENLNHFYDRGVRLITLTWNYENEIGYPNLCTRDGIKNDGLKPFGEEVVLAMNELGMIIDVSHLSDEGFYKVASLSKYPFVASHSNARAVAGHSRNLTDDMIKTLSEKGGVMGLNFAAPFLGSDETSKVSNMILHLKHIYNVGGIDVMALGSDFDGIDRKLEIDNAGEWYKLIDQIKKAGFKESEIDKITYENSVRVIKDSMK